MRLFLALWGVVFVAFAGINMAIAAYAGIAEFTTYLKILGFGSVISLAIAAVIGIAAGIAGNVSTVGRPERKDAG